MINTDHVIVFYKKIVEETGGSVGIKDRALIESALNRAYATFDGQDLYPTIIDKISAITFGIISNHAFVDGNKRIGVSVMLLLLKINNISIQYTQEELVHLGLEVASGKLEIDNIKKWILTHQVK